MRHLLDLKEFEEVISRGRFKGGKSVYKMCITGDNYCWHVSRHNYKANEKKWYAVGVAGNIKYVKGFVHLFGAMCHFTLNPLDYIEDIIKELEKRSNTKMDRTKFDEIKSLMAQCGDITPEIMSAISRKQNDVRFLLEKIGTIIDSEFRTNYNIVEHSPINASDPDCIYHRIFSKEDEI